jgi:hypothetical protein
MRRAIRLVLCLATLATPASATPSQQEVFKSIQSNVSNQGGDNDGGKGLAMLFAAAGALIVALVVGSRLRQRQAKPKVMDHPGKLIREVLKATPLKARELKQLKLLAEETRRGSAEEAVENPLTLILCPSVLARALKNSPNARLDREILAQMVRKMGVAK